MAILQKRPFDELVKHQDLPSPNCADRLFIAGTALSNPLFWMSAASPRLFSKPLKMTPKAPTLLCLESDQHVQDRSGWRIVIKSWCCWPMSSWPVYCRYIVFLRRLRRRLYRNSSRNLAVSYFRQGIIRLRRVVQSLVIVMEYLTSINRKHCWAEWLYVQQSETFELYRILQFVLHNVLKERTLADSPFYLIGPGSQ